LSQRIRLAVGALTERGISTILRWIPGHSGIQGNEIADQIAGNATSLIGPHEEPAIRYLSAIKASVKARLLSQWESRWKECMKGRTSAYFTPEPSKAVRKLHAGRKKEMSSLLVQLRTEKIGFNAFLYERKVPTVLSPRCPRGSGAMTVRHVLLVCPTWSALRTRLLGELRTSDIRVILNSTTGATAATRFILHTNLLDQFRLVAREAQADSVREEPNGYVERHVG
jgi:hypothetical protein